jgi:hypothetical protein
MALYFKLLSHRFFYILNVGSVCNIAKILKFYNGYTLRISPWKSIYLMIEIYLVSSSNVLGFSLS